MATLGKNIKELRKQCNMNQKEFANKMNTTQQRVSEWECDKIEPSFYNIIKMLTVFDITFEELIESIEIEKE